MQPPRQVQATAKRRHPNIHKTEFTRMTKKFTQLSCTRNNCFRETLQILESVVSSTITLKANPILFWKLTKCYFTTVCWIFRLSRIWRNRGVRSLSSVSHPIGEFLLLGHVIWERWTAKLTGIGMNCRAPRTSSRISLQDDKQVFRFRVSFSTVMVNNHERSSHDQTNRRRRHQFLSLKALWESSLNPDTHNNFEWRNFSAMHGWSGSLFLNV